MGGWAPRALKDSVRPRRLSGVLVRPLNFTVRSRMAKGNPAVLVGPARRLKLLRLIANFAWLVSLAFIGVIAIIFHFSPTGKDEPQPNQAVARPVATAVPVASRGYTHFLRRGGWGS